MAGRNRSYNDFILISRFLTAFLFLALFVPGASAQPHEAQTLVVMPFENESHAPGLEWIGEAFPEVINQRLTSPSLFVIGRDDRLYGFDRVGIPANIRPSKVTLYEIAQEMDADYAVLGRFTYDGQAFTGTAQLLDVKKLRLLPEVSESGSLLNILEVQNALAWDLLNQIRPGQAGSKHAFIAASPAIRLDAFENYIRGITSTTRTEKIRRFREAVRLNPEYNAAIFQFGKTYFAARDYDNAAQWLSKVPHNDPMSREANFYEGLSWYYLSQFAKAEDAFSFVASRLPLTEIDNNLGVVESRRGKRDAQDYFEKAVEADPKDADYRFNWAVSLYRAGDSAAATRQLREALSLHPGDSEAKALLDQIASGARNSIPLERIKRNYDEASFRQLEFEIVSAMEQKLAQSDPATHAKAHIEQGQQMLAEGFTLEAEKRFREAVLLDPTNATAHAGLAASLLSGDPATARAEAATAIHLQPSAQAYVVLAQLDSRDNKPQEASANVDRALALDPANATAKALKRDIAARLSGPSAATPKP
jgi:tetratricopeptide (TPR) repeat protein